MREGMFIKKNVEKWTAYQHNQTTDPDETADRFITLVDDLSYAKTFYPKSKVTHWINSIAAGIYHTIYRNKKEKYNRIFTFWKFELPLLFKKYHSVLLFTFIIFLVFVMVGVLGSIKDDNFIRGVLGDNYVDMTEDNISKGDPFGIYKSDNPFSMFVQIAMNNSFIALLMVMGGVLLGIPTIFSMWQNGLMLGCFQYMFFAKGLGMQSVMVIWVHGTIEILSLVIASAAGFIIARGTLFPATFSRLISFKIAIKDALKIMITLIPLFILASFFESYLTHLMSNTYSKQHNAGMPVWVSAIILFLSFTFIIWYFIIYPIKLHKKYQHLNNDPLPNKPVITT